MLHTTKRTHQHKLATLSLRSTRSIANVQCAMNMESCICVYELLWTTERSVEERKKLEPVAVYREKKQRDWNDTTIIIPNNI